MRESPMVSKAKLFTSRATLCNEGVDVRVVKEMMRHESLASTEIYTRVSMKRMFDGIEHLPLAA